MPCLCDSTIPNGSIITFQSKEGVFLGAAHKACPEHGFVEISSREPKKIKKQQWLTQQQALSSAPALLTKGAKVLEKSSDKRSALFEWEEWDLS